MKWHNLADKPVIDPNMHEQLLEYVPILITDGKTVGLGLYDLEDESLKLVQIKNPTHYMFIREVFSPKDMLKLFGIINSQCANKDI